MYIVQRVHRVSGPCRGHVTLNRFFWSFKERPSNTHTRQEASFKLYPSPPWWKTGLVLLNSEYLVQGSRCYSWRSPGPISCCNLYFTRNFLSIRGFTRNNRILSKPINTWTLVKSWACILNAVNGWCRSFAWSSIHHHHTLVEKSYLILFEDWILDPLESWTSLRVSHQQVSHVQTLVPGHDVYFDKNKPRNQKLCWLQQHLQVNLRNTKHSSQLLAFRSSQPTSCRQYIVNI